MAGNETERAEVERIIRATLLEWTGLEDSDVDWDALVDTVIKRLAGEV